MTTTHGGDLWFEARARCFRGSNGGVGILTTHRFCLDPDGTVRVYDSIAGYYTVHHGMTTREESRVRNLALSELEVRQ